jgi:uncharacterized protein YheU (UPF0270 family)
MKFKKYECISQRKEWKAITDKIPTDEIKKIWDDYFPFRAAEIKFLATLIHYDQSDIVEKFHFYRSSDPNKMKANTLENFILKYGEDEGRRIFESKNEKCKNTLKHFIERHGVDVGTEKYNLMIEGMKNPKERMIKKYGEVEGLKRYEHFCERNKGNHSLERKLELYSEEEAYEKYHNFLDGARKRASLKGCIELYGEVEGKRKYYEKREKIEFGNSEEGFQLKYGDEYREIMRKSKDNTSLDSFVGRYGEDIGNVKYMEHQDKMKFVTSLDGYKSRYGEVDGYARYKARKINPSRFGVSPISQELFKSIKHEGREYYADLNHEYLIITPDGCFYIDYVNKDNMKAVEFNGDCFHANPEIYSESDRPNPFDVDKTSRDIWELDRKKLDVIKGKGFDVLVVWEKDYRHDKKSVIEQINQFIYG